MGTRNAAGPKGEKRPADAIARAVKDTRPDWRRARGLWQRGRKEQSAAELGRKGGKKLAEGITPERRAEIAKKAAAEKVGKVAPRG